MSPMPIQMVAQELVEAIKPLIGERIVSVSNINGKIVASTDPSNIGLLHKGAAEAASRRSIVRINPSDLHYYPGAKEGISLPVIKNGELIGVVGIHGVPDEVEQTATLLRVCVDLYLEQAAGMRKTRDRNNRIALLLRNMLSGETMRREEILDAGRELQLDLRLPVRVLAVSPDCATTERSRKVEMLQHIHSTVCSGQWLDENHDVCAVLDDLLVIVKHIAIDFDAESYIARLHETLNKQSETQVGVAMGGRCDDWKGLVISREEAAVLLDLERTGCMSIESQSNKVMYMIKCCLDANGVDRYLVSLRQALRRGFGDKDMDRVMSTIRAYCEADCRSGKAAENLGIHKNTMNYRMNKIIALLGMEDEKVFVREFFLRLLLMHHYFGNAKPNVKAVL